MSVTVAITVTFPNTTAALLVATATDISQDVGPELIRLLARQVDGKRPNLSGASAATVIT
jgi:hypothetical protein